MGYKYLALFIIASAFCNNSSIQGFSTDSESKEPLIGANIMLDGASLGAASDENGYYIIKNIPIGTYTLRAMFIGYETKEKEIWVDGSREYTIDIKLKPSAIELEATRVTAEKRKGKVTEAPASIEIISSRDIKRESATNMGSYLKGLKGVDFTSSGINNYSISIRGFNSSFNTRVLTLTDGRVANIPALRVINYSAVPQSMDDIDRMEVVLGPATALYGANAHSGVVNIISKPPSQSQGLTMSVSGSNDERQQRKINGRWAQKLSNNFSIKISGMYFHGYEWPYISEEEYKSHLYPWTGNPYRRYDGKDNNPWTDSQCPVPCSAELALNIYQEIVAVGNGEPNHGDLDGDLVAGEDWFNGYDDDGDAIDSDGDGWCNGQELQWALENGTVDEKGWYNYDNKPEEPIKDFSIWIDEDYFTANGLDDDGDGEIDEDIDGPEDQWTDGFDNDQNGKIDDGTEMDIGESGNIYGDPVWGYNMEENNIIIKGGRSVETIHGKPNPWYIEGATLEFADLKGDIYYDEEKVEYIFDLYIYDWGEDGKPGDPYKDKPGDEQFQPGEGAPIFKFGNVWTWDDCGLDGICELIMNNPNPDWPGADADGTEGDRIWQPGDCWIDDGNGIIDQIGFGGTPDGYDQNCNADNNFDKYPNKNGQFDPEREEILGDCGNDGFCWNNNWVIGIPQYVENLTGDSIWVYGPDPGEGDGPLAWDDNENDGKFDSGDAHFGWKGDQFEDANDNDRWDPGETLITDLNGDGLYTPPDYTDDFQFVDDINGDGLSDYPDFEVENRKVEFRIDFDPSRNINMTFQSGYSWTKTQQVTGTSRYLADGFEYKYYQLRGRFHNWFSQVYMNQSFSGNTRNYSQGNVIDDQSINYAFQLQRNNELKALNTKLVWGIDYFKTLPSTNGTILNDGPNGYDNDGDNEWFSHDGLDNDNDGETDEKVCPDGMVEGVKDGFPDTGGRKNGKQWQCDEGIDEPDEFDNPESNEYGIYYQTKTELFGTSRFELITAARWDHHDQLSEGVQFAPKIGFIHKPNEKSSFRFTYGKAFNTPNSITLYTDLYVRKQGIMDVYLRGNKDGTPYCRVGQICSGSEDASYTAPGFYYCNGTYSDDGLCSGDSLFNPISPLANDYFAGNEQLSPYSERVDGAPYFFNQLDGSAPNDMIPLDTSRYLIYVPELHGGGYLYTPEQSFNISDVDPIKTEKIQTVELGYKGFFGKGNERTHITLDYYISYYEDFFSPPTFITPVVVLRDDPSHGVVGILPVNSFRSNPPYGTAWNGEDDDKDWAKWADEFGWGDTPEIGEWGFINYLDIADSSNYQIYHPEDVIIIQEGTISINNDFNTSHWDAVGVDEWRPGNGLSEAEDVPTFIDSDGNQLYGPGLANSPPHLVLSPMNYGDVWVQGVDMSITHLIPEHDLVIDGNISWYGTTEFYNELTKKNDPINAPKWKWNASIIWDSSLGDLTLNYRHVNEFTWKDGIWAGVIGPYDIFDFHYNYFLTDNLELSLSALNFMNSQHKELIGGAQMGRQLIMRVTSIF